MFDILAGVLDSVGEIGNNMRINSASQNAESALRIARNNDESIRRDVLRLESKLEGLSLMCQALWELLSEKTNLRLADIEAKVAEIDLRDGQKDGKLADRSSKCENCGRQRLARQQVCMFCGAEIGFGNIIFEEP